MDVVRSRRTRESNPERGMQSKVLKHIRKVQVVYYLTRNGQLEHPHYMEVTHLVNQPLCLRDVMQRLTALRGQGMPSLYSWSCKRSYKNGYVWNDLADNDIIPPSGDAEYVLKGSELVQERIQQLQISNRVQRFKEPSLHSTKAKSPTYGDQQFDNQDEEREDEYELDEEKTCYTSSTTPHSRCSRGVSTDELEEEEPQKPVTESAQQNQGKNSTCIRFEDGDSVGTGSSAPSRSSVLLQLIACGNLAANKAKNVGTMKGENLQRGVVCKCALKKVGEEEDDEIINYMSENPRFSKLEGEEKEYFSGSIVESMNSEKRVAEPLLKKSNSYNLERRSKGVVVGERVEDEEEKDKSVKGKCIPRKKSSKPKPVIEQ